MVAKFKDLPLQDLLGVIKERPQISSSDKLIVYYYPHE